MDLPLHCLSVGDAILVYWDGDRKWYPGKITAASGDHDCEVLYQDGMRERISLDKAKFIVKKERTQRRKRTVKSDAGSDEECEIDIGETEMVACRRSIRLREKSTFHDISSSKNSVKKESHMDPPCFERPSALSSSNSEACEYFIPAAQTTFIERVTHKNRGSSKRINTPQPKKTKCFVSNKVEYNDGEADHEDELLDQSYYGDSNMSFTFGGSDGLLCSICQIVVGSDFLVQCKNSGCLLAFHIFCLCPPLQTIQEDWLCASCDGDSTPSKLAKDKKIISKKVQHIVGRRRVIVEHQEKSYQDQFLIKWDALSHHHDSWVPFEWMYAIDPTRLHSYIKKCLLTDGSDSIDERKPEWFKIDRAIACRRKFKADKPCEIWNVCSANQDNGEFEFLVKWRGLDYCDATWESSFTEELLAEVSRLIQRHQRASDRTKPDCASSSVGTVNKTPDDLYDSILYDYQLQGVNWILSNFKAGKNVILADEMGLGKTVQVVSFINCMKEQKLNVNPVLIIAPKSILFQWEKEFGYWARDLNVIIYQGEKQSRLCIRAHEMYSSGNSVLFDALVTNYERVILDSAVLKKFKWSAIIIDEAHKIKNLDCKLASYLKRYNSDFRLLLTGTPLQNTLLELFALLHFIDPEQFSDPIAEAEKFSKIKAGLRSSYAEKQIAQIHEILKPRMLRRMKSDVLPESIPVKKWVEVPCALTDVQREMYIDILEKNYEKLNKEIRGGRKIILNFILMELRKCCNHPYIFPGQETYQSSKEAIFQSLVSTSGKLQLLEKLLPKLKERGNRVLLFSQMTKMLDILEDFLMFLGLSYFRIDGSTSMSARQQQMKEFNNADSKIFIFLISTRAGGLGLDLPSADRVVIYDPDFNPFMDLQAQSRAHRIGQTHPVVVYQLITKCSVEEKILQKSKEKLAIENLVMNPSKKPTVNELHSVLLHGARKILNRKSVKDTSILYDDNAIETLLKLDPAADEKCSADENGYLGSIQSFTHEPAVDEEPPASPKAAEWENILGPVQKASMDADFGRGKRQKKEVKYDCDDESDSDDIYSPEGSSADDSGDESDDSEPEIVAGEI